MQLACIIPSLALLILVTHSVNAFQTTTISQSIAFSRYAINVLDRDVHLQMNLDAQDKITDETFQTAISSSRLPIRYFMGSSFSLVLGIISLLAILINRIAFTPYLYDSQARTDLIALIANSCLILNGVYLLDLNVKEADSVTLIGKFYEDIDTSLMSPEASSAIRYFCETLIRVKAETASVILYANGRTIARYGVMGPAEKVNDTAPILAKALRESTYNNKEVYLPALQSLPGKVEFDYLPSNCQSVIMLPILDGKGIVIVGANRARAYSPKDITWMNASCKIIHETLSSLPVC